MTIKAPPKPPSSYIATAVLFMKLVSYILTLSPLISTAPPTAVNAFNTSVVLNLKSCVAELFMKFVSITVVLKASIYTAPPRIALFCVKFVLLRAFKVPLTYIAPPRIASFLVNCKSSTVVLNPFTATAPPRPPLGLIPIAVL